MRYLLTGDEFGAVEALQYGLVQEVVAPGQEFAAALDLCHKIARQAPLSVAAIIENCRLALGSDWMLAATRATSENNRLFKTEDAAEGRRAFAEKRPAIFRGR